MHSYPVHSRKKILIAALVKPPCATHTTEGCDALTLTTLGPRLTEYIVWSTSLNCINTLIYQKNKQYNNRLYKKSL
jgi:hypothetical protein